MKLQILELPMHHVGEYSTTPYALIASDVSEDRLEGVTGALGELQESVDDIAWTLTTDQGVEL